MINIGVIGKNEATQIINTLNDLFYYLETPIYSIENLYEVGHNSKRHYEILIINEDSDLTEQLLKDDFVADYIILNADNKNLFGYLGGRTGTLITYGFCGKSCVTASSIVDGVYKTVQLCVQRSLPTIDGQTIDEQEFPISIQNLGQNIYSILAAITAALVAGLSTEKIAN